jgi:hypothetical protein
MGKQSSTSARMLSARAMEVEAVRLRLAGMSYSSMSERLGVSASSAHRAVLRSLARTAADLGESADALRSLELQRLDALLAGLWPAASAGDPAAVSVALRVSERRAKLLGLDAPSRRELSGADGGPIEIAPTIDLTRLSDADLATLDALLARAAA